MVNISLYVFEKIKKYFGKDYSYEAILNMLRKKYRVDISLRTLSRLLSSNFLKRKNIDESPVEEIVLAIILELQGSAY